MTETAVPTPPPEAPTRRTAPWTALPLRLIDLILMVVLAGGTLLALRLILPPQEVTTTLVITLVIGQNLVILAIIWLVAVALRGATWRQLGLVPADGFWYRRVVPLAIGLQVAVILVNAAIASMVGRPFENPQIDLIVPDRLDWFSIAGMVLATAVFAPVAEELALRGVLYGWLRRHVSPVTAGLISAAGFALLHGIPALIPGTFLVGLLLAWIYERSRSIWPAILVHACFNAISTVVVLVAAAALDS